MFIQISLFIIIVSIGMYLSYRASKKYRQLLSELNTLYDKVIIPDLMKEDILKLWDEANEINGRIIYTGGYLRPLIMNIFATLRTKFENCLIKEDESK